MNYLMLSVGRRGELLKDFRMSIEDGSKIIATDLSPYAPAIYFSDKQYLVPRIDDPKYIDTILDICKKEQINAVTTFIDPEIEILAKNRDSMKKLCGDAQVEPSKVFPHNFRHLFAKCFYSIEKNLSHLADILGHSSIETTRIYVAASITRF